MKKFLIGLLLCVGCLSVVNAQQKFISIANKTDIGIYTTIMFTNTKCHANLETLQSLPTYRNDFNRLRIEVEEDGCLVEFLISRSPFPAEGVSENSDPLQLICEVTALVNKDRKGALRISDLNGIGDDNKTCRILNGGSAVFVE